MFHQKTKAVWIN